MKVKVKNEDLIYQKKFELLSYKDIIYRILKNKDRIHDIHQRYYNVEKEEKWGDYP